jgi:hypothetical protein
LPLSAIFDVSDFLQNQTHLNRSAQTAPPREPVQIAPKRTSLHVLARFAQSRKSSQDETYTYQEKMRNQSVQIEPKHAALRI